jgi:chitinase
MKTTQKYLTIFLISLLLISLTSYGAIADSMNKTFQNISIPSLYAQNLPSTNKKIFVGYYESWCAQSRERFCEPWNTRNARDLQLARVAPYVNMVIVSFMKPNATYQKNSFQIRGNTGLEFNAIGEAVKEAIQLLRNRGTKVLVSVGGFNYSNDGDFERLNSQAIADVVEDFGFDGVDICFEPHSQWSQPPGKTKCERGINGISCNTDTLYRQIVAKVREKLPRNKIISVSAWSTGAYGEGTWQNSQPDGPLTGLSLNLLRSPEARYIDQLNVMSYEAGSIYNPKEALAAYQNYFKKTIVMGIQVPPEGWPPEESKRNVYTIPKVRDLTQEVINRNADGMMLWTLQSGQARGATQDNPNAEMISQEICRTLALGNCQQPLFSN